MEKKQNHDEDSDVLLEPVVQWTAEHEKILIEWADKALCYKWLHEKSHVSYSRKNTWFTIPVIIMSTLTGTANFAQNRVPADYVNAFTIGVGAVNILAGILTTIQQFLKISEYNESHRVSSISWGKFYRNIKVELAKSPSERVSAMQLLKVSKDEYDRLIETSHAIDPKIIKKFKDTFSGGELKYNADGQLLPMNNKQTMFSLLKMPEDCDVIESTVNSLYKPPIVETKIIIPQLSVPPVNNKFMETVKKMEERKKHQIKIQEFINNFKREKLREPTSDEIIDNLNNEVPEQSITDILSDIEESNIKITIDETV
jgi:hypothetical protein